MSTTLTPVGFFADTITLDVDTATSRRHVGRHVTLAQFAKGQPISLYRVEEAPCRFVAYNSKREFIEGDSV